MMPGAKMQGFAGFPDGKQRTTPMPNLFFSDLLPIIDNIAELKVTLYAVWALGQREGAVRYLRLTDFMNDPILLKAMGGPNIQASVDALLDGVERAVARGTFLHVNIEGADGQMELYFLNTEKGRAAVEGITRGEWRPTPDDEQPITLLIERPNIFVLYEQNIGALTPMIADELREAERTYPPHWIEDAIKLAVTNNVRRWRYIQKILERWSTEGRADAIGNRDSQRDIRQQIPPEYQDVIKR
ncbi:DnaD domain-containing protein [Promineifilum sp.]|uniref:DnaD domain-containing protein n=1 Tax=Promineifilum sp. TaxID=2664178 RepID=UPI0035B2C24E